MWQSLIGITIVRDDKTEQLIRKAERSLLYSRSLFEFVMKALTILVLIPQRRKKYTYPVKYRKVEQLKKSTPKTYIPFGNISYDELKTTAGEIYTCKVGIERLLYLVNQPILYSAKIHKADDSVTITIKEKDRDFLLELIEMQGKADELDAQNAKLKNQRIYKELKESAIEKGEKLQYLVVSKEQKSIIEANYIKFAYFEKGDKFNITFLPEKAELIKRLVYATKEKEEKVDSRVDELLKGSSASPQKLS